VKIPIEKESSDLSKKLLTSLKISPSEQNKNEEQNGRISIVSSSSNGPDISYISSMNNSDSMPKNFQDLVLYKPNHSEEKRSLDNFEHLTINNNESFSLCDLLKEHTPFQNSKIVVNRFHSNAYKILNPKLDDSYYVISTLLRYLVKLIYINYS
jgi:hypothetical protein